MNFLAAVPLIAADIPAVLSLDERCLGGLWTKSGYQRELESDCSDLFVLVSAANAQAIQQRAQIEIGPDALSQDIPKPLAAQDLLDDASAEIRLLGVGCLWAILEEAHITTLAVEPSWQGRKLGLLLLCQLLQSGYRRGLTRATLEVRASNKKALGLYQLFGFKAAGMRKRYYSDGENACILWRSGLQDVDMQTQISQQKERAIASLLQNHQQKFIYTDTGKSL